MSSADIRSLQEAYLSIYGEVEPEFLEEENLLFESIEDLYDDEVEEIVEETIYDMLDEGYDFDEIEEVFEDIFSEAKVTTGRGGYTKLSSDRTSAPVSTGSGSKMAAQQRLSARKERKRAETVAKVKGAVKGALSRVKGAIESGVEKAKKAGKEAKFQAVDKHVAQYANRRELHHSPGLFAKAKDPAKRRALRSLVAKDIASRAIGKLKRGAEKIGSAATSAAERAREAGSSAKAGVKRGIRGAALSVARSMKEDQDLYDMVLDYLLTEGYAETEEAATVIMTNMSEEWRAEIIDEANRAERELGLTSRERARARNLNQYTDKPMFYKSTKRSRGDNSDPLLNKAHKGMSAKRQASHKAGRHLRGDTGESGNVVRSRYQANKDHKDGYPSIRRVDT